LKLSEVHGSGNSELDRVLGISTRVPESTSSASSSSASSSLLEVNQNLQQKLKAAADSISWMDGIQELRTVLDGMETKLNTEHVNKDINAVMERYDLERVFITPKLRPLAEGEDESQSESEQALRNGDPNAIKAHQRLTEIMRRTAQKIRDREGALEDAKTLLKQIPLLRDRIDNGISPKIDYVLNDIEGRLKEYRPTTPPDIQQGGFNIPGTTGPPYTSHKIKDGILDLDILQRKLEEEVTKPLEEQEKLITAYKFEFSL